MTCLTGHPHLPVGVVISRAGRTESEDDVAACMHAAQRECNTGLDSSDGVDVDRARRGATSEVEVVPGAPSPPPSVKWCTLVCTIMSMSRTARILPTRRATEMCRYNRDLRSTCKRRVKQETLVPSLPSQRLSQQDNIDVNNLYSILRNQKF